MPDSTSVRNGTCTTTGNAVYGLGLIGALIYFLQQADTFWEYVLAVLKAVVWPAFVVYQALQSFYG
jgi:hypothetical protein